MRFLPYACLAGGSPFDCLSLMEDFLFPTLAGGAASARMGAMAVGGEEVLQALFTCCREIKHQDEHWV